MITSATRLPILRRCRGIANFCGLCECFRALIISTIINMKMRSQKISKRTITKGRAQKPSWKWSGSCFERYKDAKIHEKPKELESRGGAYYSESACSLMNSLYHHSMDIQTVNTLNKGSIPDLPDDAVIEFEQCHYKKRTDSPDRRKTVRCHQRADHLDEKI